MGNCAAASQNITVPQSKNKSPSKTISLETFKLKPIPLKGLQKKVKQTEPEPTLKQFFTYLSTAQTKVVEKVLKANPLLDLNQLRFKENGQELTPLEFTLQNKKAATLFKTIANRSGRIDFGKCLDLLTNQKDFQPFVFSKLVEDTGVFNLAEQKRVMEIQKKKLVLMKVPSKVSIGEESKEKVNILLKALNLKKEQKYLFKPDQPEFGEINLVTGLDNASQYTLLHQIICLTESQTEAINSIQKLDHSKFFVEDFLSTNGYRDSAILQICAKLEKFEILQFLFSDKRYRDFWSLEDLERMLTPTTAMQVLDSPSFKRVFTMQTDRVQIDFVSKYAAQILQLKEIQLMCVPLLGYITQVEIFRTFQDFPSFKNIVAQVNPQLLATFEGTQYEQQMLDFISFVKSLPETSDHFIYGSELAQLLTSLKPAEQPVEVIEDENRCQEFSAMIVIDENDDEEQASLISVKVNQYQKLNVPQTFNLETFKRALMDNDQQYVTETLMDQRLAHQIPIEVLFMEWKNQNQNLAGALQDYGLIHHLIARNYSDELILHMLTKFQVFNNIDQLRDVPIVLPVLNRNKDFDKGVNRIVKMISDVKWSLLNQIPLTILTNSNRFSLLRHVVKQIQMAEPDSIENLKANLQQFIDRGLFKFTDYTDEFAKKFNDFFLKNQENLPTLNVLSLSNENVEVQFGCASSQANPVLLAIKSGSSEKLKVALHHVQNLIESLRGSGNQMWLYSYVFDHDELTLPFESLGIAMLLDETVVKPEEQQLMMVQLLKDERFLPLQNDFTSLTKYCLQYKRNLLLKTFLSSFKMQFIFRSYSFETQKQIVQLLITGNKNSVFEPQITLNRPYSLCALSLLLSNYKTMPQTVSKELLRNVTRDQIVTFSHVENGLIKKCLNDYESGNLLCINPNMQANMNKLVERIKNDSQGLSKIQTSAKQTKMEFQELTNNL